MMPKVLPCRHFGGLSPLEFGHYCEGPNVDLSLSTNQIVGFPSRLDQSAKCEDPPYLLTLEPNKSSKSVCHSLK